MYMKTTFRSNPDFTRIYNETGKICVSIIIPTHKLSPERQTDKISVSKAIEKAGKLLKEKFGVYNLAPVIQSMNELFNEIDFDHNEEGLGLFVSETDRLMVKFPFPVVEKVIIGNHFEIRDLLIAEKYNTPYLLLHFNEQGAKLYHGQMDHLREIKDDYFPAKYVDDYEYNPPGKANFHTGSSVVEQFDKDKSVQQAIHFKSFLQKTDKKITPYLTENVEMIIMAPKKELAWFHSISSHFEKVITSIHGNFQHDSLTEIANTCWKEMKTHLGNISKQEFDQFREKIGQKHAVFGLDEVWKSAKEGRALKLLVEKDFMFTGYTDEQEYLLHGSPAGVNDKILPDAVDELIRMVLDKNGGVCFTENDLLKDYNRIALITRY
jgi:Bacterial archaeo-eukaryotic release factor family 3